MRLHILPDFFPSWIRGQFKRVAVIIHGQHVSEPAGDGQRQCGQPFCRTVLPDISLDRFTEADGCHLRDVHGDPLGRIPEIPVREPFFKQFIQECLRGQNPRIRHHVHAFHIADQPGQFRQLRIMHAIGKQIIAQHAVIGCQSRMNRIQADGHLHAFCLVHRFAVGHVHPGFFQRRPAVGEMILNHQVLRSFRVDKRRNEGLLRGDHRVHVLQAPGFEICGDCLAGPRRDLVDHRPREGNGILIADIGHIVITDPAGLMPFCRDGQDGIAQRFTIAGTVVHGDQGQRCTACFKALLQHRRQDRRHTGHSFRTLIDILQNKRIVFTVFILQGIPLLGNRESHRLQRGAAEDLLQPLPLLCTVSLGLEGLAEDTDDLPVHPAVGVQDDIQRKVVIRAVDPVHHLIVEAFDAGNAAFHQPLFQQLISDAPGEYPENIADAEMNPDRFFFRLFCQFCRIITRQGNSGLLPGGSLPESFQCQFHCLSLHRCCPVCNQSAREPNGSHGSSTVGFCFRIFFCSFVRYFLFTTAS